MRSALWGALLAVVILVGAAPAANAAITPCADGTTNCDPYNTDQTESVVFGTSGQTESVVCRAVYGKPSTYCFLEAWIYDEEKQDWVRASCARGYTSAGWCTCDSKTRVLRGSCSFR
jgi:hypothetical protein